MDEPRPRRRPFRILLWLVMTVWLLVNLAGAGLVVATVGGWLT